VEEKRPNISKFPVDVRCDPEQEHLLLRVMETLACACIQLVTELHCGHLYLFPLYVIQFKPLYLLTTHM
jgi:hypothetical protein